MTIRKAGPENYNSILTLLEAAGLPTAGVPESPENFLLAECGDIVGVIGMEKAGQSALIRSLAVKTGFRSRGIGTALLNASLKAVRGEGCREAYTLTATAEKYLAKRGFIKIDRSGIPAELIENSGLNTACPSCSTCMKIILD